jgi:hypothetical protein
MTTVDNGVSVHMLMHARSMTVAMKCSEAHLQAG